MRYPEGHKDEVRRRLVQAASAALRHDGLDGVSIPAIMKKVGLTHGAFYAHFKNRDALVSAAIDAAADETAARILGAPLPQLLSAYLSPQHVARPGEGCVVAALGAEGRRARGPVRRSFARAARGLIQFVQHSLSSDRASRARGEQGDAVWSDPALEISARMVGAIVLARLVDDDELSHRLLEVAKSASLAARVPIPQT